MHTVSWGAQGHLYASRIGRPTWGVHCPGSRERTLLGSTACKRAASGMSAIDDDKSGKVGLKMSQARPSLHRPAAPPSWANGYTSLEAGVISMGKLLAGNVAGSRICCGHPMQDGKHASQGIQGPMAISNWAAGYRKAARLGCGNHE